MNALPYDVPEAWLCVPPAQDRTMVEILQSVRKIALRILLSFPAAQLSPEVRRPLAVLRRMLPDLMKLQPAVVFDALANPDVLTPLLILDVGQEITGKSPDDLMRAAIPALLMHLSHRAKKGAIPEALLWDLPLSALPDATGMRVLRFDPPARGLVADPLGLELRGADHAPLRVPELPAPLPATAGVTVDHPFQRLHPELPRLLFSTWDSNPLSMFEAHPDKDGNAISLGERSLETWLSAFREALELIRLTLPGWFEEAKVTARRFVPVGYLPERHLSASYREAPGVAYLTLCDNPMTIAEAMIHETQHSKVNLLSWIDPVVHNGLTCWTQSPVRPDLRPLWGVLLAAHAFVPVAAMHYRLAALDHPVTHTERFPRRRCEVIAGNHRAMVAVLENADASPMGRRMIDEMNNLHEFTRARCPSPPPGMNIDPDILPPS